MRVLGNNNNDPFFFFILFFFNRRRRYYNYTHVYNVHPFESNTNKKKKRNQTLTTHILSTVNDTSTKTIQRKGKILRNVVRFFFSLRSKIVVALIRFRTSFARTITIQMAVKFNQQQLFKACAAFYVFFGLQFLFAQELLLKTNFSPVPSTDKL